MLFLDLQDGRQFSSLLVIILRIVCSGIQTTNCLPREFCSLLRADILSESDLHHSHQSQKDELCTTEAKKGMQIMKTSCGGIYESQQTVLFSGPLKIHCFVWRF